MPCPRLLRELLVLPTASFVEDAVLGYIKRFCRSLPHVDVADDSFGNVIARYGRGHGARNPIAFTAHTDHPGFISLGMIDRRTVRAAFRGDVRSDFFKGQQVRFWSGRRQTGGQIVEVLRVAESDPGWLRSRPPDELAVRVNGDVAAGAPGMWDLPGPLERYGYVYARGCDDVAGCAAVLAMLERVARREVRAEVYCVFTRAEEVGLLGAVAAAKLESIPRDALVITIETSSARPGAAVGEGPILRVGDRSSVFTPEVTAFCNRVAAGILTDRPTFQFQRKLMDGGTCESTAFLACGYATTGLCIALGNYHNMDLHVHRIAPEYISLADWHLLVDWMEAIALDDAVRFAETKKLRIDLESRWRRWVRKVGTTRQDAVEQPRRARSAAASRSACIPAAPRRAATKFLESGKVKPRTAKQ